VTNRVKTLAAHRRARLNEAQTLHQFFRDIDDEEAWIKYAILCSAAFLSYILIYYWTKTYIKWL